MNRYPPGTKLEWTATPPGGLRPRQQRPSRPYTGPPRYPAMPRWGFPPLAWRWPLSLALRRQADPVERVAALASTALSMLWVTVMISSLAAVAEAWRYGLLLRSLVEALPKTMLAISDSLVITAGVLSWIMGVLSGVVVVLWALRARNAANERAGMHSARSDAHFVAGVLVPGWNVFVPGSVLAEIEHTVLVTEGVRKRGARPSPSRLVRVWWTAWVVSLVLGWVALLWSLRTDVQSLADGVVLHLCTDLAVVVVAVLTIRVIQYFSRLLIPVDATEIRTLRVVSVPDAPPPVRAQRPEQAPR